MTDNNKPSKALNAWIAIDHGLSADPVLALYTLRLKGERSHYQAIAEEDWVLILNTAGHISRVGRVLRIRSDLETTIRWQLCSPLLHRDLSNLLNLANAYVPEDRISYRNKATTLHFLT